MHLQMVTFSIANTVGIIKNGLLGRGCPHPHFEYTNGGFPMAIC